MIKIYCDICGEEITPQDKSCQYKVKKFEPRFFPYSQWDCLTVHKSCWQRLSKLIAENGDKPILSNKND